MRDGRSRGVRLVGRARVPGGTWRRAQTSGPSQDATLASGAVGLRKFRIAQLLRETARAACAMGHATSACLWFLLSSSCFSDQNLHCCCCCSTQRALPPDPQAREPLSLWTEALLLLFNTTRMVPGPPSLQYSTVLLYSTVHSIGTFCTMFSHIGGGRSGISQTTMTRTEGFGYVR